MDEGCCCPQGYATVVLNGQTWLAENLNIDVPGASGCYGNNLSNCADYGRLYNWEAAQTACAQLGDCWRVPTDDEWRAMGESFGGTVDYPGTGSAPAYTALIDGGSSGFDALLGGYRNPDGSFHSLGVTGFYWSGTENGTQDAWDYCFYSYYGELSRGYNDKPFAFSCRCVQG